MAEEGDNSSNVPPRILQMKETPWSNERIYPDPVADRMKARFFQQTQLTETPNCFKLVMQQSALFGAVGFVGAGFINSYKFPYTDPSSSFKHDKEFVARSSLNLMRRGAIFGTVLGASWFMTECQMQSLREVDDVWNGLVASAAASLAIFSQTFNAGKSVRALGLLSAVTLLRYGFADEFTKSERLRKYEEELTGSYRAAKDKYLASLRGWASSNPSLSEGVSAAINNTNSPVPGAGFSHSTQQKH